MNTRRKSVGRGALHLLLCMSLAACATPQKVDPVADYCTALTKVLRNCENILEGNSTSRECLESPDTLTEKFEAALNSLPDKTVPRFKLITLNLHVVTYYLDYVLRSSSKGQSKKAVDVEDIVKECNAFAAEPH